MRALVLDERVRLRRDLSEPERPPGEVEIALRTAGVCDTDLQLARGYMAYQGVLGHEFVGEVVGADDSSWLGRRVVGDINAGCGTCSDCRERDGHHCRHRTVLGIVGRRGCFSDRFCLPQSNLVAVPDELSDVMAVFAEPLAAALHVLDDIAGVVDSAGVAVLGDGKLGLLIAMAVRSAGHACSVIGRHEHKLELARAVGCTTVLEEDADHVPAASFDAVIEATGSVGGSSRAFELTRPRGTVVLKTTVAQPWTVDLSPVVIHELRLLGSRCGDLDRAIRVMAEGRVDPRPLVEADYDLDEAEAAIAHAGRRGALKVLLTRS